MRKSALIIAGTAIALAGTATVAAAEHAAGCAREHVTTVLLPDGSIGHVRDIDDVASRVILRPVAVAAPVAPPSLFDVAFAGSPFAAMERMSAAIDAQLVAMMGQASAQVSAAQLSMATAARSADVAAPRMTVIASAPAGATYRYVSTSTVNGKTCTTSIQSVAQGEGKAPALLRQVSGDCSTAIQRPTGPTPAVAPAPPAVPARPVSISAPAAPMPPVAPTPPVAPDSI